MFEYTTSSTALNCTVFGKERTLKWVNNKSIIIIIILSIYYIYAKTNTGDMDDMVDTKLTV